jgi:formylmethanofuran dehydrogenase subunit E
MKYTTHMGIEMPEDLANYLIENNYSAYMVATIGEIINTVVAEVLLENNTLQEIVNSAQDIMDDADYNSTVTQLIKENVKGTIPYDDEEEKQVLCERCGDTYPESETDSLEENEILCMFCSHFVS